jgi:hypothetical protein
MGKIFLYPFIIFLAGIIYFFLLVYVWDSSGRNGGIVIILSLFFFIVLLLFNLPYFRSSYDLSYYIKKNSFNFRPSKYLKVIVYFNNIKLIENLKGQQSSFVYPFNKNKVEGVYYPSRFYKNLFKIHFKKPIKGFNPIKNNNKITKFGEYEFNSFILGDDEERTLQQMLKKKWTEMKHETPRGGKIK